MVMLLVSVMVSGEINTEGICLLIDFCINVPVFERAFDLRRPSHWQFVTPSETLQERGNQHRQSPLCRTVKFTVFPA